MSYFSSKFTLSMLACQLKERVRCIKIKNTKGTEQIFNWKFWVGEEMTPGFLYLITQEQLVHDEIPCQNCCLICPVDSLAVSKKCSGTAAGMLLVEGLESAELANLLQDIFFQFVFWGQQINEYIRGRYTISGILDICADYLKSDIHVVDADYRILGQSRGFHHESDRFLPLDVINELIQEEDYAGVGRYRDAFIYPEEDQRGDMWYYCQNLYLDNVYAGRLILNARRGREDEEGMLQFTAAISGLIQEIVGEQNERGGMLQISREEFYGHMENLLKGQFLPPELLEKILTYRNWKSEDLYQVAKVEFLNEVSTLYYCTQMEKIFSDCIALSAERAVYVIRRIDLNGQKGFQNEPEFPVFLRESLAKAGLSAIFSGISEISFGKKEADVALKIGQKLHPSFWIHGFDSYILPYLAEKMTEELKIRHLCHPAVKCLQEYDQIHGSELAKTLKYYLMYQENSTYTANALYIHRTTLIQRIHRIMKLTQMNLQNSDTKLHLLISFYLIEQDTTVCI